MREARVSAQLPGNEVAQRLRWSASKVSRIETGRICISLPDLDLLVALYAVPDEQAEYLRRLAPSARKRGWWDAYTDSLSAGYAGLLRLESGSRALQCYCPIVPHPFDDDAGLRPPGRQVVLATWQAPCASELDRRIRIRRRRQAVLENESPEARLALSAVIDEALLHRSATPRDSPEGNRIQLEQFDRLVALEVDRYARDYELLTGMALSPPDSLKFIQRTAEDRARRTT